MSELDREAQRKAVQRKLRALVDCVLAMADEHPAFGDRLAKILLSERPGEQRQNDPSPIQRKEMFNPVLYLKEHGDGALRRELEGRTDDDLRAILRFQGLRRGKELKKLERSDMLKEISSAAQMKLKQGMTVARMGATEAPKQLQTETLADSTRTGEDGNSGRP